MDLAQLDRQVLWHPFTQQQGWTREEPPVLIERAEGTTLVDTEGRSYIDGVSSLWCTVHGHRHPAIDAAVRHQLDRVAHSTMLGLSHPPAVRLAARLVDLAPEGLQRVFYSDSGSTAVEVALKMAYQYWQQRGERERTAFVCLRDAYHGDTVGSVSVGGIDLFHSVYRPLLFESWPTEPGRPSHLADLLARDGRRVAAVVMEPLVQGAAGIQLHPPGYLRAVRELCDEHGVLLICDEVATGLGRTGRMFACEHEAVAPDFLCLAKGLTGGYMPLAATLTTERVYEGFLGAHEEFRTFFHGHTYTGNPLACAAALACLDVFRSERTLERLEPKMGLLGALLDDLVAPLDAVAEVRRRGFMVGIELAGFPVASRMGHRVTLAARERGAILRPLGDVVVLMPPLGIEETELRRLVEITAASIAEATSASGAPGLATAA
ncbi:MAG TPA: adenosylmethionine--8-amino-7-oxononanoate transaminase [Solirubrobacteraceae bacterium]|nr:adenosylmethionine--8-amino-7-oxononanoate transaminase [Solirubrobacteraceae bacterium]